MFLNSSAEFPTFSADLNPLDYLIFLNLEPSINAQQYYSLELIMQQWDELTLKTMDDLVGLIKIYNLCLNNTMSKVI